MKEKIVSDLKSSVVVFLVALPLCLGIALASNAPLSAGIIAGIVGGIVIGFISGSDVSVSGPAAGLTVIVAMGIQQLGSFELFCVAVTIAGLIQIILGLLKAGNLGEFFPVAVIKGMLAAIGVILITKQLKPALGITTPQWSLESFTTMQLGPLILSVVAMAILLSWEKLAQRKGNFFQLIPGPLVAVVFCVILNQIFVLVGEDGRVALPSNLWESVGFDTFDLNFSLMKVALTIAVVASLETLLCMDAAEKMDPLKRRPSKSRELLAQGVGNSISGLLGGLPLTSVIVRTTANINSGNKTKLSAIIHGFWLLVLVMAASQFLNLIPLATLSSILLLLGYKLAKPSQLFEMNKRGSSQLIIFLGTIIAIVATDLLIGIFVGFFISLLLEIKKLSLKSMDIEISEKQIHIKFVKDVSFLHRSKILKTLNHVDHHHKHVKISGLKKFKIHVDIHELLYDQKKESEEKGINFHLD